MGRDLARWHAAENDDGESGAGMVILRMLEREERIGRLSLSPAGLVARTGRGPLAACKTRSDLLKARRGPFAAMPAINARCQDVV